MRTHRFMPIWLKDQVLLSPSMALAMEGLNYIAIAFLSPLMLALSKRMGRVLTVMVTRSFGISILLAVACMRPLWSQWQIILPMMWVRMGIMNCTGALTQSIMNDYAPKKTRGRWNALDSVRAVGWSGSAALGGYLVDHFGYEISFIATAIGTAIGTAMRIPLLFIVEDRKNEKVSAADFVASPQRHAQRSYVPPEIPAHIPTTPSRNAS